MKTRARKRSVSPPEEKGLTEQKVVAAALEQIDTVGLSNFSLRDVEYRTECVPRRPTVEPFSIKGQALTVLQPQSHAALIRPMTGRLMMGRPAAG